MAEAESQHSPERIKAARAYAASINQRIIDDLESGVLKANDPASWIADLRETVSAILAGEEDHNFTIWQRMHFFLTGKCVPLLPAA